MKVDVIGGRGHDDHSLLSQVPGTSFSDADIEALTQRVLGEGSSRPRTAPARRRPWPTPGRISRRGSQGVGRADGHPGCASSSPASRTRPRPHARDARPRRRGRGPDTPIGHERTPSTRRLRLIAQAEKRMVRGRDWGPVATKIPRDRLGATASEVGPRPRSPAFSSDEPGPRARLAPRASSVVRSLLHAAGPMCLQSSKETKQPQKSQKRGRTGGKSSTAPRLRVSLSISVSLRRGHANLLIVPTV